MMLPELTEDDKKFIDETLHGFDALSLTVLALHAKANNLSLREADQQMQDWYNSSVKPVINAHFEKHAQKSRLN